jgi:hypothetical protein
MECLTEEVQQASALAVIKREGNKKKEPLKKERRKKKMYGKRKGTQRNKHIHITSKNKKQERT